jgi:hypothetical protein
VESSDHSRVARALSEHGPLAPPALRFRIENELGRASRSARPRRRLGRLAAAAGGLAACLALLAVALSALLGTTEPSVADVHGISAAGPEAPAPPPERRSTQRLAANLEGVAFPNLEPRFGWRTVGERADRLDGRETRTVFYEHEGHLIGYTVVGGDALDVPSDAERLRAGGVEVALLRDDHGHDIAVFERGGKTCVLSGHVERRSTLVELATWSGDGRVPF